MKKITKLLFPIILLGSLVSCSKDDKVALLQKENIDKFVYVNNEELDNLLYAKNNFVLVVGQEGCSSCEIIKPVITSYIKKYEYIIHWVEIDDYKKIADSYSLDKDIMTSTVLIFNNGKLKKKLSYDKYLYYDKDNFELTMEKLVTKSNIYSINDYSDFNYSTNETMLRANYKTDESLSTIIENDNVNVLFAWNKCKDCIDFSTSFIFDYMKNTNKKLYVYEVSYLRSMKNEDDTPNLEEFTKFALKYQFNDYRGGKVPTIVTYSKSVKKSMVVYLNDEIEESNGVYIVKNSFYPDLINKENVNRVKLDEELKEIELGKIKEYLKNNL